MNKVCSVGEEVTLRLDLVDLGSSKTQGKTLDSLLGAVACVWSDLGLVAATQLL